MAMGAVFTLLNQFSDLKWIVSYPHQLLVGAGVPQSLSDEAYNVGQLARCNVLLLTRCQASSSLH